MAEVGDLQAIIAACEANILAAMTGTGGEAGSMPNASGAGSIDHDGYIKRQRDTIDWARQQLEIAQGPFMVETVFGTN